MDRSALDAPRLSAFGAVSLGANRMRLQRIAALLDRPVEAFGREGMPADGIDDASTMLRLWSEIPDDEARREVLALARVLAKA